MASSNKTNALTKSMNMRIWEIGALNQSFMRRSYNEIKFSLKQKLISGRFAFFVIGQFCTHHSIYLNIDFLQLSFVWNCCAFSSSTSTKK